ncbi:MAG: hypothetical protein WCD21_15790 [Streptomyces sp.]
MPRHANTKLLLLLNICDWNAAQLARAMGELARERGVNRAGDRSTVTRWLAGTQPRADAALLLLQALTRRLGRPVTAQEAGLTRAPAYLPPPTWEGCPMHHLARLTTAETDPTLHRLLVTGEFSLAALTLPDSLIQSASAPVAVSASTARRAGSAQVEELGAMTRMFADAAALHGGEHTRPALAAYLHHTVRPLLRTAATQAVHRSLLVATSHLTLLLGTMCDDAGRIAAAQHYHHTAARLAADADDHAALAMALRAMATHAHNLGHHLPAVGHLAEAAADHARHAPDAVRAYTLAQLAVVEAHDDRRSALATFTRAEHHHTRSDQDTEPPGPFTIYPEGALHFQRAHMLATFGDARAAARALSASLAARTPRERHPRALTHAHYAETLHRVGRHDEALIHWHHFFDLYPHLTSTRAAQRLATMRRLLAPHRHRPRTRDLLSRASQLGACAV